MLTEAVGLTGVSPIPEPPGSLRGTAPSPASAPTEVLAEPVDTVRISREALALAGGTSTAAKTGSKGEVELKLSFKELRSLVFGPEDQQGSKETE